MPRFFNRAVLMFMTVAGLALFTAHSAKAVPITQSDIPGPNYTNRLFGGIVNDPSSNQFQGSILPTPGLSMSGSGNGPSGPTLFNASTSNNYSTPSVSAFALANAGATAQAQSYVNYFVAFSGADGTVPVNVQASGGVDSTGGRAYMQFELQLVSSGVDVASQILDITGGSQLFSLNQTYQLAANSLYRVIMDTETFSQGNGGAASAHLDPFFSVPAGFTVLTSTGIGNAAVATTPIPAALPLFASGLGILGFIGRRRKTATVSA